MTTQTLLTDVKVGETIYFNDGQIAIRLEEKSGQRCKFRIVHQGAAPTRIPPVEKAGVSSEK